MPSSSSNENAEYYNFTRYLANHEMMARPLHDSVSYPPLSLDPDLDEFLSIPQPNFHEGHSLQQLSTENSGRLTPQINWSFAEDPQGLLLSGSEVPQMSQISQSLAAPTQAQQSFIRLTTILNDSFLETPTLSHSERLRLAACTGLDGSVVSAWFDIMKNLMIDVGANSIPMPNIAQDSVFGNFPNLDPPRNSARPSRPLRTSATSRKRRSSNDYSGPSKRRQIEDVSQDKDSLRPRVLDNVQKFLRQRPSKNSMEGPYCCPTTACKFSTMNFDQWHTHQIRKHFPSEIFVCGINSDMKPCNKGPDNPCKRKDNFVTHLKECHGYESGHALDQEVLKRTVKVTGLFHDTCGFCSEILDTREASIEHIGDHIKSGDKITDWTHRCTSLEHTLQHHVHFEISLDRTETDDNSSENNFEDLIQNGDYEHGDGGKDCTPTVACASTSGGSTGYSVYAGTFPSVRSAGYTRDSHYACVFTSERSARYTRGDTPYACTISLGTSARYTGYSHYACAITSGRSAGYTRDSPYVCVTSSRRYTGQSLARSIESAGTPPSSTTTRLSSTRHTRRCFETREGSFLDTWYESDNLSYRSNSDYLRQWERQPNYSPLEDWNIDTKLPNQYRQESSRRGALWAHSSFYQGSNSSWGRENRDERNFRIRRGQATRCCHYK